MLVKRSQSYGLVGYENSYKNKMKNRCKRGERVSAPLWNLTVGLSVLVKRGPEAAKPSYLPRTERQCSFQMLFLSATKPKQNLIPLHFGLTAALLVFSIMPS